MTSTTKKINTLLEVASSMARLYDHTKNRTIGMITAYRGDLPLKENKARNAQLAEQIRKAGYGYVKVAGRYVENYGKPDARNVDEQSFLVIGPAEDDKGKLRSWLVLMGHDYDQDSVLYKPSNKTSAVLIGTRVGSFPGINHTHDLGEWHPNRVGEFYSLMKKNSFNFERAAFVFQTEKSFFSRGDSIF